jgi:hypothetical protein
LMTPLVEVLRQMRVKEIVSFPLPSKATSSCTLSSRITARKTLTRSDSRTLWMLKVPPIWLILWTTSMSSSCIWRRMT